MALKHVNAVIVGAGAGGGVVAKELAEAGLSVVVLERGGWGHLQEHFDDEFLVRNREELLGPGPRHVRVIPRNGKWVSAGPNSHGYWVTAAAVGGGTVFYGALAWRFVAKDFRLRSIYGAVPGSTLEDWPISYEDLEPCYEKVEWEIGVAGDMKSFPQEPSRKKDYPMPAFPYDKAGGLLAEGGKRIGMHPFPMPMFRNSIPYNNRPACISRRLCSGVNCPVNAKNGTHNTVIPKALATGACDLRTGCMASEIVLNDRGHATGVRYFDANGRQNFQPADIVILAAGATETPRLLLNSKSRLFPNGAGNNQGWVGRNLHAHLYAHVSGIWDEEVNGAAGGRGPCVAFVDYLHHNPGMVGGALIEGPRPQPPLVWARSVRGWGQAYKNQVRRNFKRRSAASACVLELPVFDSRVEIDPQVKDPWGIPVPRIMFKHHPNALIVRNFIVGKMAALLHASGAVKVNAAEVPVPKEPVSNETMIGEHQAGTCRMGSDPKTSVTSRYGQLHEIGNVFCADASLHVTNASLNPVGTVMALGYWVSDFIRREWKGTKFRGN